MAVLSVTGRIKVHKIDMYTLLAQHRSLNSHRVLEPSVEKLVFCVLWTTLSASHGVWRRGSRRRHIPNANPPPLTSIEDSALKTVVPLLTFPRSYT